MSTLVICRHGHANLDGQLSEEGQEKTELLAKRLMEIVPEKASCVIVSSITERTMSTSQILQQHIGGDIVERTAFGEIGNIPKAVSFIKSAMRKCEYVVVVTHKYHIKSLFEEVTSSFENKPSFKEFEWGAHVLDLETGEYIPINTDLLK